MVLEKLGTSLKNALSKIARSMFVDDRLIEELIRDIQRALLQADVNVKLVFELSNRIKERAKKEKTPSGITKKEHLIKIVYEELVKFLGDKKYEIKIEKKPFKIMLVGLYGSGKTTTAAKIAKYYLKRGYKVCTVGLDMHRPAAPEQLKQLCEKINVACFIDKNEKNPIKIWDKFKEQINKFDIVVIDTAGRDVLSKDLVKEIKALHKEIKPNECLLVISADIGQAAQFQAQEFNKMCNITGVIATKMDGTAKAGGALTACVATDSHIKFIGVGEKIDDIEEFNPKGFVSRLLGMGDIEALLKKAEEVIKEEKVEDVSKKIARGEFNLLDLYEQMQAMKKMGPLSKLIDLIPGLGSFNLPKELLQGQEHKLEKWKYIMQSMTREELENPEIIGSSRVERIAKGSGVTQGEVRELLKQFRMMKKMLKVMKGEKPGKILKMFGKKFPKGFPKVM